MKHSGYWNQFTSWCNSSLFHISLKNEMWNKYLFCFCWTLEVFCCDLQQGLQQPWHAIYNSTNLLDSRCSPMWLLPYRWPLTADRALFQVSLNCDYVFVNGKETRGSMNARVVFSYEHLSAPLELTVWVPKLPLVVELSDSTLSFIKGWRVPILPDRRWGWAPHTHKRQFCFSWRLLAQPQPLHSEHTHLQAFL